MFADPDSGLYLCSARRNTRDPSEPVEGQSAEIPCVLEAIYISGKLVVIAGDPHLPKFMPEEIGGIIAT